MTQSWAIQDHGLSDSIAPVIGLIKVKNNQNVKASITQVGKTMHSTSVECIVLSIVLTIMSNFTHFTQLETTKFLSIIFKLGQLKLPLI
jgi:hypothetical protein